MQAIVGVVQRFEDAQRIVTALEEEGLPHGGISILSPGSPEAALRAVPTTDAEQPGIGGAIGSVVGGAAGGAGALAVASLAIPGLGPIVAAGAIAGGLVGAMAGGAMGAHLDDALSTGLPKDELYVYRHALRSGRSVVVALVRDNDEADRVRELMAAMGAESVDAAREAWWTGLRDAEGAEYQRQGGDFEKDEAWYRQGFDAACRRGSAAPPVDPEIALGPDAREPRAVAAFQAGYERGRRYGSELVREDARSNPT